MNSGVGSLAVIVWRESLLSNQNSLSSSFSARCHGNSFLEATRETTHGASKKTSN